MFYTSGTHVPDGAKDFVDAGSGRDIYDGYYWDYGADVINLDNKAHDGFAANLTSVSDHSLDETILNFEDASGGRSDTRIYGTA